MAKAKKALVPEVKPAGDVGDGQTDLITAIADAGATANDAISATATPQSTSPGAPAELTGQPVARVVLSADASASEDTKAALGELMKAGIGALATATGDEREKALDAIASSAFTIVAGPTEGETATLRDAVAAIGAADQAILPAEPSIEFIRPQVVRVIAAGGPRRRAGFAFGPKPRDLTFAEIEDAGRSAETVVRELMADPFLSVGPAPPDN